MSFNSLGLSAELLRAVSEKGYSEPTPIQSQAIPVILAGKDVLAGAQTGTGKTAGFTLPLLDRLCAQTQIQPQPARKVIRALVLTPTRELAAQVEDSIRTYGKYVPLKSAVIFGGVGFNPQVTQLRQGIDILVATPGRLLDHVGQRTVDLSHVEILVLDEADRMLDMGFIRDIRRILALLPKKRQNLLFSATYTDEIKQLADGLLNAPTFIEVARRNLDAELVSQVIHPVDRNRKRELLSYLIGSNQWQQVLVFTRTKHGANRLAEQLDNDGISSTAIHGNKSQGARTRALADFKSGAVRVLVATDIAARGLDIDQLPHVVNYELPNVPEDYVHRIGRTGRAGREGQALSLVCVDEIGLLKDIQRLLKRELPKVVLPGYEPDLSIRAEPIRQGREPRRGGRDNQAQNQRRPGSGSGAPRNQQRPSQNSRAKPQSRTSSGNTRQADSRTRTGSNQGSQNQPQANRVQEQRRTSPNQTAPQTRPDHGNVESHGRNPKRRREAEVPALFGGGKK